MIRLATLIFILAAMVSAAPASAQLADLSWNTVDCGGGQSGGGAYLATGAIGQFDACAPMTGGGYSLGGGFWAGVAAPSIECLADINASGGSANVVDIDDLLAVISAWGFCPSPCPPNCPADIAGSNCSVNIDDLLAVISAWGPCP